MAICVKCGKESDSCLCDSCKPGTDIEALCREILAYKPEDGGNPLWEQISGELENPYHFHNLVFVLSEELPEPRNEYMRVMCFVGGSANIMKSSRPWFYEVYERVKEHAGQIGRAHV